LQFAHPVLTLGYFLSSFLPLLLLLLVVLVLVLVLVLVD